MQTAQNATLNIKTITTAIDVSHWNDQYYKITGGGGGGFFNRLTGA